MGSIEVQFHKGKEKRFHDVSGSNLIFSSDFMEKLTDAVKKRQSYSAVGIKTVHTSSGPENNVPFFVIEFSGSKKYNFLFKILSEESSKLVGVNPEVNDKARLKYLVNLTVGQKSNRVRLII